MPFSPRFLICALWSALALSASGAQVTVRAQGAAGEVRLPSPAPTEVQNVRAGAARALRLVDAEGRALRGEISEPKWETRGGGLFFTRDFAGTRNIWRAFPDPLDPSRYPRWRALPVTQFVAPLFAVSACPLDGDRVLLMRSNATNPRGAAQVIRFDLKNVALRALTNAPDGVVGMAPAPDGQSFAFTAATRASAPSAANSGTNRNQSRRGGAASRAPIAAAPPLPDSMAVWTQSLGRNAAPELVAQNAWRPAWQSASLLVESVADGAIFRLSLAAPGRRNQTETRLAFGTQISASRDGATLVLVGKNRDGTQLYVLSGDGSGQRALPSTEGAQSPALSGDGRLLAFIAPLIGEGGERERALWILPLQSDAAPAISQLPLEGVADSFAVNSAAAEMAVDEALPTVAATVSSPAANPAITNQTAVLSGGEVRPLALKARFAGPVALIQAVQNAPGGALAIWGTASGRGASATLEIGQGTAPKRWEARPIFLPVAPDAPLLVWNPPGGARGVWNFRLSVSGVGGAAQSVFSVQLPLEARANTRVSNSGRNQNRGAINSGSMPAGGPLPAAPLPDLPAPPLPSPAQLPPLLPLPPAPDSRVASNPGGQFSGRGGGLTGALPPGQFGGQTVPSAPRPTISIPAPTQPVLPELTGRDAATFNVSDTLAQMKAGQRVSVTFWALNRGTRTWFAEPTGGNDSGTAVRLVSRWLRFDNGNRSGWTYQNMKTAVAPNGRASWKFELVAPSQPGRYKLIYSLQRVAPNWTPPAYDALQERWPDDFAAIAFAVTVKP